MAYIRIRSRFNGDPAGKTGTHDCRTLRGLERVLRTYRQDRGWSVNISMTDSTARLLGATVTPISNTRHIVLSGAPHFVYITDSGAP